MSEKETLSVGSLFDLVKIGEIPVAVNTKYKYVITYHDDRLSLWVAMDKDLYQRDPRFTWAHRGIQGAENEAKTRMVDVVKFADILNGIEVVVNPKNAYR